MIKIKILSVCFLLAVAILLPSCADRLPDMTEEAASPALTTAFSQDFYARVAPGSSDAYRIQLVRHADGSATVSRSIVPHNSAYVYQDGAVIGASAYTKSGNGADFSFNTNVWYIPFDPGGPISALATGGIEVDCSCDGNSGSCDFSADVMPGGVSFGCFSRDCTGNCDATITSNVVIGTGGLVLAAAQLQSL
ncbi:MAG: hypothetical protein AAGN35_12065 [Bacteroidota bacterium]